MNDRAHAQPQSGQPDENDGLVLRFAGSLVEQLGAQLYPSATATVAELISNAWDADAEHVWVDIPFGEGWTADSEIVVLDDGHGMTREMARTAYLIVGRNRRAEGPGRLSEGGRKVHGRKGIGKLAAFGTAGTLECTTKRDGETTAFRLDYDELRHKGPGDDYEVEIIDNPEDLVDPEGNELTSGTRIRLTDLHLQRAIPEDQFLRSMSRRFAISAEEMTVEIGDHKLKRFNMKCEFRFPKDGYPDGVEVIDDEKDVHHGWAREELDGDRVVKWWIGFTPTPLDDASLQGISVLAEGKMAQRPFKFEHTQGLEGQLGFEYMIGEVRADWLDTGVEIDDDLIQSNRDQLRLESDRLAEFLEWGRKRVAWALRRRNQLKQDKTLQGFTASDQVEELLEPFTTREKRHYLKIAQALSKLEEADEDYIFQVMGQVVDAHGEKVIREMMDRIVETPDEAQAQVWDLIHQFGLIDARRRQSTIEARMEAIDKLRAAVEGGAREVPEIHNIIVENPWLIDPRWEMFDDETDISTWGVDYEPELDDTGNIIDFVFGLKTDDEVIVVEIKRGTNADESIRKASLAEVQKFQAYLSEVEAHFDNETPHTRVRGLMIANGYVKAANRYRKKWEQPGVMEFRTWERVLDETHRLHVDWLEVSRRRSGDDDEEQVVLGEIDLDGDDEAA